MRPKDRSELNNSVSQSKLQTFHSPNFHFVIPAINRCYLYKLSTLLVNATLSQSLLLQLHYSHLLLFPISSLQIFWIPIPCVNLVTANNISELPNSLASTLSRSREDSVRWRCVNTAQNLAWDL